jgi:hypothetical protein
MFSRFCNWLHTHHTKPARKSFRRRLFVEQLETRCLLSATVAAGSGAVPNLVEGLPQSASGLPGYTPAQMRQAYGFTQIPGLSNYNLAGQGETIAIVDAYGDPNLRGDVQEFDETFNIGGVTGDSSNTNFLKVVNEYGGSTFPAPDPLIYSDWYIEESIDVEWAHAIAPGANILLVQADNEYNNALDTAVRYAESQPNVCVVSMSFSEGPEYAYTSETDGLYTTPVGHQGIAFVAASGDYGASQQFWPQGSPNVLDVGGTTLPPDQNGNPNRSLESGWSGSGGGISPVEAQPAYQDGIQAALTAEGYSSNRHRAEPDVAYDADPSTGVPVYATFPGIYPPGWTQWGGTSIAAPQWAALIAIADQGRVAAGQGTLDGPNQLLPAVYQIAQTDPHAFNDITTGFNGYNAGPGYDLVTGLGTPNAQYLVPDLVHAYSTPAAPTTVYWTGAAGDDNWNDPGNWSYVDHVAGSVLPGPNDNVVIDLSGATINHPSISYDTIASLTVTGHNVTLNLEAGTLDLSGAGTLGTFQVDQPGDVVNLMGSHYLTGLQNDVLKSATITSHTTITVPTGAGGIVDESVLNGVLQAQGSATLILGGNWTNNGTITAGSGSTLILGDYWTASANDSGAAGDAWINNGTITTNQATVALGSWLTYTRTNLNSLNLSTDTVDLIGALDNSRRTLALVPGQTSSTGSWTLSGGRIDGGTITATGGAALVANSPVFWPVVEVNSTGNILDGVTLDATLDMQTNEGATVVVVDGLTLNANVYIGTSASLEFSDTNPQAVSIGSAVSNATIYLNDGNAYVASLYNGSSQTVTFEPGGA